MRGYLCIIAEGSGRLLACFLIVLAMPIAAMAEDPPVWVGALSYASGEVNYALTPEKGDPAALEWSKADLNQPVCQDMSVETGPQARARVRIGADAIALSGDTVLHVQNLNPRLIEASLRRGHVFLQVGEIRDGEGIEFEMPNGSLWMLQRGDYDIEVGTAGPTAKITVYRGRARLVGDPDRTIDAGQERKLDGIYPEGAAQPSSAPPATGADDLRQWAEKAPEPPAEARQTTDHVSPETTGYDELAAYGIWQDTGDYGPVWFPDRRLLPADWEPYLYGHWDSIAPWGLTWIDDQPWGFAPFHYGRWVEIDSTWGWTPGAVDDDPVYAPALVAFLDTSDDAISWVPLGPGETYSPWYDASPAYLARLAAHNEHHRRESGRGHLHRFAAIVMAKADFAAGRTAGRHRSLLAGETPKAAKEMPRVRIRALAAARTFNPPGHGTPNGPARAASRVPGLPSSRLGPKPAVAHPVAPARPRSVKVAPARPEPRRTVLPGPASLRPWPPPRPPISQRPPMVVRPPMPPQQVLSRVPVPLRPPTIIHPPMVFRPPMPVRPVMRPHPPPRCQPRPGMRCP